MKVSDVINFAVTGELKPLGVAEIDPSNADRPANINTLISYINQGIIELYKRFNLATQSQVLTNVVDGANYTLNEDFLYLVYVEGNDAAESAVGINDEESNLSVFTPTPFQLFVSIDQDVYSDLTELYITYAAVPALLTKETDVVALPYQFLEALINYMAYKAHSSLAATPQGDNNTYYKRFEESCARITRDGLNNLDNGTNFKLKARGFV